VRASVRSAGLFTRGGPRGIWASHTHRLFNGPNYQNNGSFARVPWPRPKLLFNVPKVQNHGGEKNPSRPTFFNVRNLWNYPPFLTLSEIARMGLAPAIGFPLNAETISAFHERREVALYPLRGAEPRSYRAAVSYRSVRTVGLKRVKCRNLGELVKCLCRNTVGRNSLRCRQAALPSNNKRD
jgi:hypothetical protein